MNRILEPKPYSPTADKVAELIDRVVRGFDPVQIVIFGSYARGDMDADSDVDVYVVLSEIVDKVETAAHIAASASDILMAKDIFVTTPQEIAERGNLLNSVLRTALRDGVTVYERPTR